MHVLIRILLILLIDICDADDSSIVRIYMGYYSVLGNYPDN